MIKTKTEVAALNEFLDWIESLDKKDGIIFVYHEQKKFIPMMIIEALRKYRLMDRFEKVVKSFVNGYELGETDGNSGVILKYLNLSQNRNAQMEKLGMNKVEDEFEGDAAVRAKLSYEIVKLMSYNGTMKELDEAELQTQLNEFIRDKAQPINTELDDIAEQEECIKRQSSLSEVFRTYFQTSRHCRWVNKKISFVIFAENRERRVRTKVDSISMPPLFTLVAHCGSITQHTALMKKSRKPSKKQSVLRMRKRIKVEKKKELNFPWQLELFSTSSCNHNGEDDSVDEILKSLDEFIN